MFKKPCLVHEILWYDSLCVGVICVCVVCVCVGVCVLKIHRALGRFKFFIMLWCCYFFLWISCIQYLVLINYLLSYSLHIPNVELVLYIATMKKYDTLIFCFFLRAQPLFFSSFNDHSSTLSSFPFLNSCSQLFPTSLYTCLDLFSCCSCHCHYISEVLNIKDWKCRK